MRMLMVLIAVLSLQPAGAQVAPRDRSAWTPADERAMHLLTHPPQPTYQLSSDAARRTGWTFPAEREQDRIAQAVATFNRTGKWPAEPVFSAPPKVPGFAR